MEQPFVSVIINCLNGEDYLKEAIDSVYAQTYTNWEIIFWDNNSTDSTAEIAQSYGEKVKYYKADVTVPLGEARNLAWKKATGDLIALLDADDIWVPTRLEEGVNALWNSSHSVCYAGLEKITEDGAHIDNALPLYESGNLFSKLLRQFDVNISTLLIKRKDLEKYNFEFDKNITASEEYNLFVRIAAKLTFCTIHKVLAKLRIHGNSLTDKAISKWAYEREYTLNQVRNENPGIEKDFPKEFEEAYARANYYRARYLMSMNDKSKAREEMGKVKGVDFKYFLLYVTLFFPKEVWHLIHTPEMKHKILPLVFGINNKKS